MIKHHPSIADRLAKFRRRRRRPLEIPSEIVTYRDRLAHAKLERNSALYDPPDNPTPEDIFLAAEQTATIGHILDQHLTPREARVLRLHYGLGCEPLTLEQIGEQFGVCRGRVQQIEKKACRKLRHPSRHMDRYADQYTDRWHPPASRNLYVPHWKREEQEQQARMQEEIEALQTLAEEEARLAKQRELQERAKAILAEARERAFDLDPAHVAEYARALSAMLWQQRQLR